MNLQEILDRFNPLTLFKELEKINISYYITICILCLIIILVLPEKLLIKLIIKENINIFFYLSIFSLIFIIAKSLQNLSNFISKIENQKQSLKYLYSLSEEEKGIAKQCLDENAQSFNAFDDVANLMSDKGIAISNNPAHYPDSTRCTFPDFIWKKLKDMNKKGEI